MSVGDRLNKLNSSIPLIVIVIIIIYNLNVNFLYFGNNLAVQNNLKYTY